MQKVLGTLGLLSAGKARPSGAPGSRIRALALLLACWCSAFVLRAGFERNRACALNTGAAPEARAACLKKALIFAPGDALSMIAMGVPMWLLYELGVLLSHLLVFRHRRKEDEEQELESDAEPEKVIPPEEGPMDRAG